MTLRRRVALVTVAAGLGLSVARSVAAYCLMTTCDLRPLPAGCSGSRDERGCSIEGRTLRWSSSCLSFSVHESGSARVQIGASDLEQVVSAAFAQWESVDCGMGRLPALKTVVYPRVRCARTGFAPEGPNHNLWIFRDEDWPHGVEAEEAIALTTLTVEESTGLILDADVELNSSSSSFTLANGEGVDLLSIAAHETGHVLGLGHSEWATSTMSLGYEAGSTEARTLEADDERAICSAMSPSDSTRVCEPEPVGGFDVGCEFEEGCCSIAPRKHSSAYLAMWFGAFVLVWHRRASRKR